MESLNINKIKCKHTQCSAHTEIAKQVPFVRLGYNYRYNISRTNEFCQFVKKKICYYTAFVASFVK